MKMTISKSETTVMAMDRAVAKPTRQASIQDTYGMGKPTRTNPVGGFMAMHCYFIQFTGLRFEAAAEEGTHQTLHLLQITAQGASV